MNRLTRPADGILRYGLVVTALTILHLVLAAALPLSGDEAYYWDCARHLDWSYFDQPPLMIWPIALFRLVLGDTALAVRMPAVLASLVTAFCLLPLLRRLGGGPRDAAATYLVLHATPVYLLGSFYESTDAGMVAAWVAATWAAVALAQGERRAWWGFGAAVGLGFLSKFPAVVVVPALLPALAVTSVRRQLATATPWAAAVFSALLTSPVWIWGAGHDWDNIRFQLVGRHHGGTIGLGHLAEFLAGSVALVSPVLAIALVIAWWKALRRGDPAWSVVALASAVPFVFFGLIALGTKVAPHWGAPGIVLAAAALVLHRFRGRRALVAVGAVVGVVLSAVLVTAVLARESLVGREWQVAGRTLRVPERQLAMSLGWDEIAAGVAARRRPGELVASESYTAVHLIAFHSGGSLDVLLARLRDSVHGLAGLYWRPPESLAGRDVLFVTEKSSVDEAIAQLFAEVEELEPIVVTVRGVEVRRVRLLRCRELIRPDGVFTRLKRTA